MKSRNIFGSVKLLCILLLLSGPTSPFSTSSTEAALGTCGNGVVDKFEQCDDGNLTNGDGCSSVCQKEGDAFRPSYAEGSTTIYLSRNIRRQLLPKLSPVQNVPPLSEFEGYLQLPWVDSVFFNFDVPAEYMASYGWENAYVMSFAGLLLTLNFPQEEKEPLLVYLCQYGIDLF